MKPAEIRDMRKTLGLTQKQLAEVIGCNMQTVQAWEQGNRRPANDFAERVEKLRKKAEKMAAKLDTNQAGE